MYIKFYFDIENKIIPFFKKYPILGVKKLDFEDFEKVSELVKNKEHLNANGLQKIIKIVEDLELFIKIHFTVVWILLLKRMGLLFNLTAFVLNSYKNY